MNLLLVGNYPLDRQESMQRFARLLADQLPSLGLSVELIERKPFFGRFCTYTMGNSAKWLAYLDKYILFPRQLRRLARQARRSNKPFVAHICDHSNSLLAGALAPWPVLTTCHDLLAVRSALDEFPQNRVSPTGKILQRIILNNLSGSQHVACVSAATRNDLRRLTEISDNAISVIYNGLNYPFAPVDPNQCAAFLRKALPGLCYGRSGLHCPEPVPPFILHVGGNQWYKNRAGVIEIYDVVRHFWPDSPDLVMAGKSLPESLRRRINSLGLSSRIHIVTECSNECLQALYSSAKLLMFPSFAEGFGWPIAEAHACGSPVVASNSAPMTEVGGTAAFYADPNQVTSFAREIGKVLDLASQARAQLKEAALQNARRFNTCTMVHDYFARYQALAKAASHAAIECSPKLSATKPLYAHSSHHSVR